MYLDLEVGEDAILSAAQAKIAKSIPHRYQQLNEFEFTFYKDDKLEVNLEKMISGVSILEDNNASLTIRPILFL